MHALATINPFYARRRAFDAPIIAPRAHNRPVYARLPRAPLNASPVPHLTSLYHHDEAGPYGNRGYPGNCGGNLIKDLLLYFQPRTVFDPMTGSGTCLDVCRELNIPCVSYDLKSGFDACDPASWKMGQLFDFVWIHPPYARMKRYSSDPRDLSATPTLRAFLTRYQALLDNCAGALREGGKLAVLMGDYTDRDWGYVPLVFYTKLLAFRARLKQHCTDIVRFSHGNSSSRKRYRSKFIPGLHDICMIFEQTNKEGE